MSEGLEYLSDDDPVFLLFDESDTKHVIEIKDSDGESDKNSESNSNSDSHSDLSSVRKRNSSKRWTAEEEAILIHEHDIHRKGYAVRAQKKLPGRTLSSIHTCLNRLQGDQLSNKIEYSSYANSWKILGHILISTTD